MTNLQSIDETSVSDKNSSKTKKIIISTIPWLIVGALLWVGLFVKPTVTIEEVIKPAIEHRDNIFGVDVVDDKNIWLCGNYGKVLKSSDGGNSWAIQNIDTNNHLQDISSWDNDRAVVVGNSGVIFVTEDGGNSWVQKDVPKSDIADKLIRVHTYDNGEAWAVGEYGMILKSADFGNTWQQMREGEDVILSDVIKVTEDKVITVGEFGKMFISLDDGKSWEEVPKEIDAESSLTAIDFADSEAGIAVGLDGLIVKTVDGGSTWQQVNLDQFNIYDHLMDVIWDKQRGQWFIVGNKGRWAESNIDLTEIKTGIFDKKDLSWHTEIEKTDRGYIAVGKNVGSYNPDTKLFEIYSNKLVR